MLAVTGWVLALLPAAVIVQHAVFLFLYRTRFTARNFTLGGHMQFLAPALKSAKHSEAQEFGLPMLLLRYGIPALLIALLNIAWFCVFSLVPELIAPYQSPMRLGALGAYVYVLLNLGQRNFHRDITSAVAVWCAVTLALGPIIAGVVSYLAISPTTESSDASFHFASAAVFFLAGLAPRYVASVIEEAARRLLSSSGVPVQAPRTLPLTTIRGITADIEARLEEEGIVDVYGLAMASPHRLLRNTSFDARQIVSWMDEALLIYNVPFWEKLEADGITGVIDLASYYLEPDEEDAETPPPEGRGARGPALPAPPRLLPQNRVAVPIANPPLRPALAAPPAPPGNPPPALADHGAPHQPEARVPAEIAALAARIQADGQQLMDIIERVHQDAQVQQVWVLYQRDSNELQPTEDSEAVG